MNILFYAIKLKFILTILVAAFIVPNLAKAATDQERRFDILQNKAIENLSLGRFTAAQWYLRQAANFAPDAEAANENRQYFREIRAINPVEMTIGIQVSPSDNINNGVSDPVITLDDSVVLVFGPNAQALPGIIFEYDLGAKYRIGAGKDWDLKLTSTGYAKKNRFSKRAKTIAPDADPHDFDQFIAGFGLEYRKRLFAETEPTRFDINFTRHWYGGDVLRNATRFTLGQNVRRQNGNGLNISAFWERQRALNPQEPNADLNGIRLAYGWTLPSRDNVDISTDYQWFRSEIRSSVYRYLRAGFGYALGQEMFGTGLSFWAAGSIKTYDEFSLALYDRRDKTLELGTKCVLRQIAYYGFSSSITIEYEKTQSNVDLFDTENLSVSFGIFSHF